MRQGPLYLLLCALCFTSTLHAEEAQTTPGEVAALQQQLADSQRQVGELQAAASGERESAQISHLRQDNQRLKLQLKQAQSEQPPRLLSEQQLWFVIGGGCALFAFIVGRLSAGGRNRRRSEWV